MNFVSLDPQENTSLLNQKGGFYFNHLKTKKEEHNEIRPGMSPKEIAEVVSDHLIAVVKEQFNKAKNEFKAKQSA